MMSRVIIFIVSLVCAFSTCAEAVVLPIPHNLQRQTQWCWASCTESITEWRIGGNVDQCVLADELRTLRDWGWDQYCSYGYRTLPSPSPTFWGHICNQPNCLYGSPWCVKGRLAARGIGTSGRSSSLSQAVVQTEVNAGRPFIMRWAWPPYTGAGHTLVIRGQTGSTTFYFDPWDGLKSANYNWIINAPNYTHHMWTHTLTLNTAPAPPIPDVKVNGKDGTYYTYSTVNLKITGKLTDGRYAGTSADWWVVAYKDGVFVYMDPYGNWTTTPTTWSQSTLADRSLTIFNGRLWTGTWYIYFGVDLTRDGILNDPLYYDYVTIVVR